MASFADQAAVVSAGSAAIAVVASLWIHFQTKAHSDERARFEMFQVLWKEFASLREVDPSLPNALDVQKQVNVLEMTCHVWKRHRVDRSMFEVGIAPAYERCRKTLESIKHPIPGIMRTGPQLLQDYNIEEIKER
jgi:hypothetical protein